MKSNRLLRTAMLALAGVPVSACMGQAESGAAGPAVDFEARIAAYQPWDGAGRYAMAQDDGVRGIQGLVTLAGRLGAKPYEALSLGDGRWATERVIFRDVDTGATVMRLTNDRWTDQLSYFQGNWSADGRYIVFRRRPGMWERSTDTHGPMVMNADGTGLRNAFRDFSMVRGEVCSPTEADVCYAVTDNDTRVVAFSLSTGRKIRDIRTVKRGWHMKVSPDGRYLMNRAELSSGVKGIWVASVDGSEFYEAPIPEAIHDSYRFHPTQKKILYWYESDHGATFWQCDFDGSNKVAADRRFDWNHGAVGRDRMVHATGQLLKIDGDGWGQPQHLYALPGEEYYDDPASYNAYSTWQPQDQLWSYHTRLCYAPHVSELFAVWTDVVPGDRANRYRICYTGMPRGGALDCPNASPDGTKVLFNANMLGHNGIYQVVARLPEPPTGLQASRAAGGVELNWKPAAHSAETVGYHVYRSDRSGVGFVPLTAEPIDATRYTDTTAAADETYFYAVTAVEHSGLESPLSHEAAAGQPPAGRHIYLSAHHAKLTPEMWVAFEGDAADLHYVWMRKKNATGKATFTLDNPVSGPCHVWARVKGAAGADFNVSAVSASARLQCEPTRQWRWVKASAPLQLSGPGTIELTSSTYGSAVDQIVLSIDDADFAPDRERRIVWPQLAPPSQPQAEVISPYAVRLRWDARPEPTVRYYNVYCGEDENFSPGQATLVASPDTPGVVDWGLRPGSTCYYRITCVNRAGIESAPSPAMRVTLPSITPVVIEQEFSDRITFEAPVPGTYAVWLHLKRAQGRRGIYVSVKVDDQGGGSWVATLDGRNRQQDAWLNYDQWGRFDLAAGAHVLSIENKSAHDIDRVFITNDLSRKPEGNISVLAGW